MSLARKPSSARKRAEKPVPKSRRPKNRRQPRSRKNHKSPNSAHTEAAAAGALDVQLAGSSYYFGKLVEKPTIGDPLRPVEPADILRCSRLMYAGAFLALVLFCGVPLTLSLAL